jgi:hypothetical protein
MHFSTTSTRPVTIYFFSLITNDARYTREIKSGIVMTKAMHTMERLFSPEILLELKEDLGELQQLEHNFVCC